MSEAPFEHLHPDDAERIAVSCADCARSDSAADELTPVDHMPIPVEALAGFPDGVPQVTRHNRRNFLRNGAVGVAAVVLVASGALPDWSTLQFDVVVLGPTHEACRRFLAGAPLDVAWMEGELPELAWRAVDSARRRDKAARD